MCMKILLMYCSQSWTSGEPIEVSLACCFDAKSSVSLSGEERQHVQDESLRAATGLILRHIANFDIEAVRLLK